MNPIVRWMVAVAAAMPTVAIVFATFALTWWTNDMFATVTTMIFDAASYAASYAATDEKPLLPNGPGTPPEGQR